MPERAGNGAGTGGIAHQEMLLRKLLHAFYWVDDGLQAHMQQEAGISLPRAQSMIMACIDDGVTRQADMAAHLRVSKQAVQQALKSLVAKGLVRVQADPDNGRQKVVSLTGRGQEMRAVAVDGIRALECALGERIGADRLAALHDALDADWGPAKNGNR